MNRVSTQYQPTNPFLPQNDVYRFGFQGQEEDAELWPGSVSYKFRVEEARLGRFFSVDPLFKKYPFYSTYSFSGNRVIDMVELEGLEPAEPGQEGEIAEAPAQGFEDYGNQSWSFTNGSWNLNASANAEISGNAPDYKAIVLTAFDSSKGEEVWVGSIRNNFITSKVSLGSLDSFDEKNRQIADFRDFDQFDYESDAELITLGMGWSAGSGLGYSIMAVSMDQGIYLYHNLDINFGVMMSVGISMSTVDFNPESGRDFNADSFVGKSQGWSCSYGVFGVGKFTCYTDGKWSRSTEDRTVLYTVSGIGVGQGPGIKLSPRLASLGAQYTFSLTSEPFFRYDRP